MQRGGAGGHCGEKLFPSAAKGVQLILGLGHKVRFSGQVQNGDFAPAIAYTGKQPTEYAALPLTLYSQGQDTLQPYASVSALLEHYYAEKNTLTRIRQKSADLRRIVQTALGAL